jgi:acyl carrier protein
MEEKLREVVAKIAETNAAFPQHANLREELKVDSVRIFELIFEIEKTFNVSLPEERISEVRTFIDLVNLVHALQASATT